MRWHGFEPEALFIRCGSENAELAFLRLCPVDVLAEQLQGGVGVGDVIVGVRFRIDVQSVGELPVALETEALVVTFQ